jgi:hypothetical protein
MWSLPNIQQLNENAEAFRSTLEHIVKNNELPDGKPLECEYKDARCSGEVRAIPYYDIFSGTPKGYTSACEFHEGYYGDEGYFFCEGCSRRFIENYTWELYYHAGDGGMLCLILLA